PGETPLKRGGKEEAEVAKNLFVSSLSSPPSSCLVKTPGLQSPRIQLRPRRQTRGRGACVEFFRPFHFLPHPPFLRVSKVLAVPSGLFHSNSFGLQGNRGMRCKLAGHLISIVRLGCIGVGLYSQTGQPVFTQQSCVSAAIGNTVNPPLRPGVKLRLSPSLGMVLLEESVVAFVIALPG